MAIEVRRVESERDFQRLHDLFAAYETYLPRDLRHGAVPSVAILKTTFVRANAAFLAINETDALGCVAVTALDRDTARMRHLFVRPEHRGLGAARSLVIASIAFVRGDGYRRFVLDTHKGRLKAAYALYRSLGFTESEPYGAVDYESPTFMELLL
ncbi:MAG: GNAT family N-acetyltransferase [Candidatus Cybelea sp.]